MATTRLDLQHRRATVFFCSGEYKRPEIKIEIFRNTNNKDAVWNPFKKYHYLDEKLHSASEQWIATINGQLVAHTGIIQFPMRKGWKRVHRLVVLPDYQGTGIGTRFINEVTKHYIENGFNMNLTTTTPALVHALARDKNWALVRKGRVKNTLSKNMMKYYNRKEDESIGSSDNRITYSFNWKR